MTDNTKLAELQHKMEMLQKRHEEFSGEINSLREEIDRLINPESIPEETTKLPFPLFSESQDFYERTQEINRASQQQQPPPPAFHAPKVISPKVKSDLEKFIGENLINKIGIAITVIGVAIGAKYSIDHDLISPLTRIILGYLVGITLLFFGIRLKKNYANFSAVLVSGAMASMYFITYAAYGIYDLIPQVLAFAVMVLFTAFTVFAAIQYNMQVIAHIGLVGAYAVPFLLSDGSGKVAILFTYMAIINAGILVLAFKKYWKALYYSSYALTWIIYLSWYLSKYNSDFHFVIALSFASIFFVIFYATFLAYKLKRKEIFDRTDILLLLSNSFIYFGAGYAIIDSRPFTSQLLGLFTLCIAVVHFTVATIIYRQKLADRNLFYLVAGLVLVFITIAIPVQLDGNWVTLLWAGEAALLFWLGSTKKIPVYEKLSYPLMILSFISITEDWTNHYGNYAHDLPETWLRPFLNINFLSSLLYIAAFGFINWLHYKRKDSAALSSRKYYSKLITFAIPAILILSAYCSCYAEISNYFNQLFKDSELKIVKSGEESYNWNFDLEKLQTIWLINYSLFFVSVLSFANIRKIKNEPLGYVTIVLNLTAIAVFLTQGLYALSELRFNYINQVMGEYYQRGIYHIWIRYVSYAFLSLAILSCFRYTRQDFMKQKLKTEFDLLLHISILWIASSELIHCMDMARSSQSYKLGLSILWGSYSLVLIVIGIWKKKKYLRIGAIALFGVTLLKLFFYDIRHLDTIAKTVIFISLGVLLLVISFLYNKYRHLISNDTK